MLEIAWNIYYSEILPLGIAENSNQFVNINFLNFKIYTQGIFNREQFSPDL
jgi:hypothetical protein